MIKHLSVAAVVVAAAAVVPASTALASPVGAHPMTQVQARTEAMASGTSSWDFEVAEAGRLKPLKITCTGGGHHNITANYLRHVLVNTNASYGYKANCTNSAKVTAMATQAREIFRGRTVGKARAAKCRSARSCYPGVYSHSVKSCVSGVRCAGVWRAGAVLTIKLQRYQGFLSVPRGCRLKDGRRIVTCSFTTGGLAVPARH
ncbi:hypothetical protein AB0J52_15055 [Spirillospora sp. NPDC049652]